RFGISMTCFSFAKLLRARKLFWIADAMEVMPLVEPCDDRPDVSGVARLRLVRQKTRKRPTVAHRRALRSAAAVPAIVRGDQRTAIDESGSRLDKPGVRIARAGNWRELSGRDRLQACVPTLSREWSRTVSTHTSPGRHPKATRSRGSTRGQTNLLDLDLGAGF